MKTRAKKLESEKGQLVFKSITKDRYVSREEGIENFAKIKKDLEKIVFKININK